MAMSATPVTVDTLEQRIIDTLVEDFGAARTEATAFVQRRDPVRGPAPQTAEPDTRSFEQKPCFICGVPRHRCCC